MENKVPQELVDEAFRRGIKPGARVRSPHSGDEFTVTPTPLWGDQGDGCLRNGGVDGMNYFLCKHGEWGELITPAPSEEEEGLKTTKDRVLEAAATGPQAKAALQKLFPDLFEPEVFEFGNEFTIDAHGTGSPLFIGKKYALEGMENKCLVVCPGYRMKEQWNGKYRILTFHKK